MIKGIKKGHCLARGTEVCVVNDMDFHMKDCKVYKIGLVSTRDFNVFGDYVYSDEWDLTKQNNLTSFIPNVVRRDICATTWGDLSTVMPS